MGKLDIFNTVGPFVCNDAGMAVAGDKSLEDDDDAETHDDDFDSERSSYEN